MFSVVFSNTTQYVPNLIFIVIRSWTVFECPVPGVRVCIRQVSPFLPHSYSEASLPVSVFHVEVENIADGTYVS